MTRRQAHNWLRTLHSILAWAIEGAEQRGNESIAPLYLTKRDALLYREALEGLVDCRNSKPEGDDKR